jgi:hypothetical protein
MGFGPIDVDGDDDAVDQELQELASSKVRWSVSKTARLLHVIVELKDDFLLRDRKLSRAEFESISPLHFWEKACVLFNDPNFKPTLLKPKGEMDRDSYRRLVITTTDYKAEAKKLKEEFSELKGLLTKALANFMISGMGDVADEDKRKEDAHKVYSSNFYSYCNKNVLVAYIYELFLPFGILFSATAEMPASASASSEAGRVLPTIGPRPMSRGLDTSSSRSSKLTSGGIHIMHITHTPTPTSPSNTPYEFFSQVP